MPPSTPGLLLRVPLAALALLASPACDGDEAPADAPWICFDCDRLPELDAPTDAPDVCRTCTADQICVQYFNGTCGIFRQECAPRVPECPTGTSCTEGCNRYQCNRDFDPPFLTCHSGGCPGELPDALHCYGP
jgi:hypothetical protein